MVVLHRFNCKTFFVHKMLKMSFYSSFLSCCPAKGTSWYVHAQIQRGGPPPTWKITKNIFFLAILVRIPWEITKLPSQHSMLGRRHTREMPFKWHFTVGSMMVPFSDIWILSPFINLKKQQKKTNLSEFDPL